MVIILEVRSWKLEVGFEIGNRQSAIYFCSLVRCSGDLEFAAHHVDTLAHADQTEMVRRNALSVKPDAVVHNGQGDDVFSAAQFDFYLSCLRVPLDIAERFLRDAEKCFFLGGTQWRKILI